jgi:hypothetical protein
VSWTGEAVVSVGRDRLRLRGRDLSLTGVALEAARPAYPGQRLVITLDIAGDWVDAPVEVAWTSSSPQGCAWGVRFVDLDRRSRRSIERYVERNLVTTDVPAPPARLPGRRRRAPTVESPFVAVIAAALPEDAAAAIGIDLEDLPTLVFQRGVPTIQLDSPTTTLTDPGRQPAGATGDTVRMDLRDVTAPPEGPSHPDTVATPVPMRPDKSGKIDDAPWPAPPFPAHMQRPVQ